jgi:hypothetical protein
MSSGCCKVMPFMVLKNQLEHENRRVSFFVLQLKTNLAKIYYLQSGKVIMLPGVGSNDSNGMLFEDKKCFLECLDKDHFPIENVRPRIVEEYPEDVLKVNVSIDSIIKHVLQLPQISQEFGAANIGISLAPLLVALKKNFKKISRKDSFYAGLILGEYLRKERNGKWMLLKRYGTFNPYYIPAILCADGSVVLFWDYLASYFVDSNTTPEIFLHLPWIKESGLTVNSDFIKNSFAGYTVLADR